MRILPLAILAIAAAALPLHAAMYKWVDEKGVTHYSETPPPDGKAQKIEVKPAQPVEAPRAKQEDWQQREYQFRQRRLEKELADEKARKGEERDAASRKDRCLRAQRSLDVLRREVPIYETNERGERVYLEDKERASLIENWKRIAEASCER